jgi:hypothetical protein
MAAAETPICPKKGMPAPMPPSFFWKRAPEWLQNAVMFAPRER